MLPGPARRVRPRHRLDRRLHVQGRGSGQHLELRSDQARERVRRPLDDGSRPQPERGPRRLPPQLRRRGPVPHRRQRRTSTTRSRPGTLDTAISSIPAQVGAKYNTDPSLKQYLHINAGDRIWYLTMNLTQPPFDDVHVRKAMNWIIDKAALQQAWGGAYLGADREPHRSPTRCSTTSSPTTSRTPPPVTTAASRRRRRR